MVIELLSVFSSMMCAAGAYMALKTTKQLQGIPQPAQAASIVKASQCLKAYSIKCA